MTPPAIATRPTATDAAGAAELVTGPAYRSYLYAYPHKTAYRPLTPPVALAPLWAAERRDALFLYLHIPFCEMRCGFCNLFTRPMPPASAGDDALVAGYLDALTRQATVVRRSLDEGGAFAFARAAIGGGTPTFLTAGQLERLIALAVDVVGADLAAIPVSVETSPTTATADRLAVLVGHGVDRISMGVQSFIDDECRAVGRPQRVADVHRALATIRASGVATLNVDLMYGIPGQTAASWRASLDAALAYAPEEIYLYPTYVRPLTGLGRRGVAVGDDRLDRYAEGRDHLRAAGYQQVSMRMFQRASAGGAAGPVYCCQDDGMIGLGCGARSYTRDLHHASDYAVGAGGVRDILTAWVGRDDAAFAVADHGIRLDGGEQRRRWLILSLLASDGVDAAAYRRRFGDDVTVAFPELGALIEVGLAEARPEGTICLTAAGVARSDAIGPWLCSPAVAALMTEWQGR